MGNAFARALAALHADANIARGADYRRPPGDWIPVRVVLSDADDVATGLGALGARSGSRAASVMTTDATPVRGDELRIEGAVYRIEDVQRQDAEGLSWRCTLATLAST